MADIPRINTLVNPAYLKRTIRMQAIPTLKPRTVCIDDTNFLRGMAMAKERGTSFSGLLRALLAEAHEAQKLPALTE
jgi:2-hydroxychromene-2-carboxylate isomerase